MSDLYQEIILEYYKHPLNCGVFSDADNVVTKKETNVGCGDEFAVSLQLNEEAQTITDIKWQGQGCAISTASLSALSEFVKAKTVQEVLQLEKSDVLELLGLEEINPGREKCLLLGLRAIQKAVSSE